MRAGLAFGMGFSFVFLRGRKRQTLLFCSGNLSERQKFLLTFIRNRIIMQIIRFRMKWRGEWRRTRPTRLRCLTSFIKKWMRYITSMRNGRNIRHGAMAALFSL